MESISSGYFGIWFGYFTAILSADNSNMEQKLNNYLL